MEIHSITPKVFNVQNKNYTKNKIQNSDENSPKNEFAQLPSTQQYLAFTGGYSLNLAETIANLDRHAAQKGLSIYPPQIREWAGMILEEGNKAGETLIAIHKKFYEGLKDCFTLAEAKKKFPEFKDVLSDDEVTFSKGSFMDKVKNGESEFFDKEEDLSLQLLKLYWADGFSTTDLKKYAGDVDLYHTMKKLNIPRVDPNYGHVLKFSDPEYNQRLTSEMTAKRLETLDRKAQAAGEPVHIKRGPRTAEEKKHISEGLLRHYQNHPEVLYDMSLRQRAYFADNPDQAKIMSRVAKKAWNVFGADRIKSALSKFMKMKGFKDFADKELESPSTLPKAQARAMREFWGANEWAKKSFSKNMEFAWKKVKQENETFYTLKTTPSQIADFVEKKAGLQSGKLDIYTHFNPFLETSYIDDASNEILKQYTNIEGLQNVMADTYQLALFRIVDELDNLPKHKKSQKENEFEALLKLIIRLNLGEGGKGYRVQTTEEAQRDFIVIASNAVESKNQTLIDIVNDALDDAFDDAVKFHGFILK